MLSCGQKHRLSIARALYSKEQNLYIFDDSLSALDTRVATRIFDQCFNEVTDGLLAGRTRVLSTRSLHFAHLTDWIIVMDSMRVAKMGTFQDLTQITPNGKNATMLKTLYRADEMSTIKCNCGDELDGLGTIKCSSWSNLGTKFETATGDNKVLIQDEGKSEGHLSWSVCLSYIVSCGTISAIGATALLFATQVPSVSTDFWLTNWTSSTSIGVDLTFYLTIYAYLGSSTVVLELVGGLYCQYAGLSASKRLHHNLLYHMIKGTMRFLDTTPVGRILTRFPHDMNVIDQKN
ncbi:unnamed protein product [Peronospora belbahrii]|uniref:ABC transmembrane type-1 domain-containing protein n=1 Tax=Peronospora belbahrii TaxID=622444 RepID=A0ABN8CW88_9STRA|nr:unnamed protein product [Peronospora belbahrii]